MATPTSATVSQIRDHLPSRSAMRTIETPVGNLTAAATTLTSTKIQRLRGASPIDTDQWMRQAWHYFETCGELGYAAEYEASSVSRARLRACRLPDDPTADPEPIEDPDHPASRAVAALLGGAVNQPTEMSRIDTQLFVTGLSHVVMWDESDGPRWAVCSNEEISWTGNSWRLRTDGEDIFLSKDEAVVMRVWNPSARRRWKPTSAIRHMLPVLGELEGLTKHVSASIDSRLSGAGLLVLPQEMDFPHDPDTPPDVDPFMYALTKAMSAPIADRDIAAATVPFAVKVPGEYVDKVKHLTFWSQFDEQTRELRDEAIRRLSLGLSIPPEILLGLAQATQSSAWQVEESTIKIHIEPRLQTMCHAFTTQYLRPFLRSVKNADLDPDRFVVWYDVTRLKLRPNRSADAKDLHDDGLITDAARRKAAGFDESDAPTEDQLRTQIIRKIVMDQPQAAINYAPLLGIEPIPMPGTPVDPADTAVDHDADPTTAPVQPSANGAGAPGTGTQRGVDNKAKSPGAPATPGTTPIVDPAKDPVTATTRRGANRPPS